MREAKIVKKLFVIIKTVEKKPPVYDADGLVIYIFI